MIVREPDRGELRAKGMPDEVPSLLIEKMDRCVSAPKVPGNLLPQGDPVSRGRARDVPHDREPSIFLAYARFALLHHLVAYDLGNARLARLARNPVMRDLDRLL